MRRKYGPKISIANRLETYFFTFLAALLAFENMFPEFQNAWKNLMSSHFAVGTAHQVPSITSVCSDHSFLSTLTDTRAFCSYFYDLMSGQ